MSQPSILACFAHPDDEVFGTGGTFVHYAALGVPVYLVCATRGDAGEVSAPELLGGETIAQVRSRELLCSTRSLGIKDPVFLDYADSGMAGTPENNNPAAFINAPADVVVAKLVELIRNIRPRAIVTFDEKGGYGHPDHIAIHRHTLAAFHAAADPSFGQDKGKPWQPERLFYRALSRSRFAYMRKVLVDNGLDDGFYDYHEENGLIWEDDAISLTVDVRAGVGRKRQAYLCHATQFGPDHPFRAVPDAVADELMGQEEFVLAYPEGPAERPSGLLE